MTDIQEPRRDAENRILDLAESCTRRLEQMRTRILQADEAIKSAPDATTRRIASEVSQERRASAVIFMCAELERFTKQSIRIIHAELNEADLPLCDIRPQLRPLAAYATVDSLESLRDVEKKWDRWKYITSMHTCNDVANNFPIAPDNKPQPPLDGRTLRQAHFQRIVDIYGLPFDISHTNAAVLDLNTVAPIRNNFAHGEGEYASLFGKNTTCEIVCRYLSSYSDVIETIALAWCEFLHRRIFLAKPGTLPDASEARSVG